MQQRGKNWSFHDECDVSSMSQGRVLYTSHETKFQFRPLAAYHISHNRYIKSPFRFCKRGSIEGKDLGKKIKVVEKKFRKNVGKRILGKIFRNEI